MAEQKEEKKEGTKKEEQIGQKTEEQNEASTTDKSTDVANTKTTTAASAPPPPPPPPGVAPFLNPASTREQTAAKNVAVSAWKQAASPVEAKNMFQGIIDFIVCTLAAIVGQELYTSVGEERGPLIKAIDDVLSQMAKITQVKIAGSTIIKLTGSQKNKLKFAYSMLKEGGDIGSWVDPANGLILESSASLERNRSKKNRGSRKQSLISQNPIGDQVIWIVRRLREQCVLQQATQQELDPIVNRILLSLDQSNKDGRKRWDALLPVDLWGMKPAPKIKPQERCDGSVIKLIQFIVRNCTVSNNKHILRLMEIFCETVSASQEGRTVIFKEQTQTLTIEHKDEDKRKQYEQLVISQLTRLGICEVGINLLGLKSVTQELFLTSLKACNLFLDAGHAMEEDCRIVQENMVHYLSIDMGEPTTQNLTSKLSISVAWARSQRQTKKLQRKSRLLNKTKQIANSEADEQNQAKKKRPTKVARKSTFEQNNKDTATMTTNNMEEESVDPGGSTHIMRLFDLLCAGQYREGQLLMANQEYHKEPVDFLIDASKYIAEMAKDFRTKPLQLEQAYGSLKSFLTGPCKPNQLHLAMETECVLVTNRILRELYKEASKIFKQRKSIHKDNKELVAYETEQWSKLGKEVVETLLSMIEGRTDAVVQNKILAVVQPRNLKDRLDTLQKMIISNYFSNKMEIKLMSEGVEIMNLLMTLSEHDKTLNKQIMKKEDPYFFFREKMGRVEIIFHDVLIPVYFFVPPMCQVFSHEPLGKMWETCLPRDESTLVKYQSESTSIFDMMKQERDLRRAGISHLFGTGKLAFMDQGTFYYLCRCCCAVWCFFCLLPSAYILHFIFCILSSVFLLFSYRFLLDVYFFLHNNEFKQSLLQWHCLLIF